MAKFAKKTKRGNLGTPPSVAETKNNLDKPETFEPPAADKKGIGRPKSNRTSTLTTTLTPEFKTQLKKLSFEEDKNIGEILEEAVNFWVENK